MRLNTNTLFAVCALAGFALPVFGQSTLVSGNAAPRARHPYTAKFQITSEQTLASGTTITHERTEIEAVDSEGRRLTATSFHASEQIPQRTTFNVNDPVARTTTNWMVPGKSARVQQRPPAPQPGQSGSTCWTTGIPQIVPKQGYCNPELLNTPHESGMMCGMGDGSVRSMRGTISQDTFNALCSPTGGELLGSDW